MKHLTLSQDYPDDLLNIDDPYFEQMIRQIYPTELQINNADSADAKAPVLDVDVSMTNGIVSPKDFMINGTILILKYYFFHFLMEMFFSPVPMMYTFCN